MLRLPESDKKHSTQEQLDRLIEYLRQLVLQLDYELGELRKDQKSDDVRRKDELSDDLFTKYLDKSQSDFSSPYTEKKNKAMTDIENIGDFKYDFADDPMYAAIRDNYARQGKLAMQDAVGKASAATGGYGNSYAASAGA